LRLLLGLLRRGEADIKQSPDGLVPRWDAAGPAKVRYLLGLILAERDQFPDGVLRVLFHNN
jgi:hypothetical protein